MREAEEWREARRCPEVSSSKSQISASISTPPAIERERVHGLITVAARRCAPPFRRGGWRERPRVPWSHEYEEYGGVCVWVPWTPRDMAPRCSAFLLPPSARRGTTSCDHQRIHLGLRCTDRCVDRNLMEWARESSSAWSRDFRRERREGGSSFTFYRLFSSFDFFRRIENIFQATKRVRRSSSADN